MKVTKEALILREILSLLESLRPAQRERCMAELMLRYGPGAVIYRPEPTQQEIPHGA